MGSDQCPIDRIAVHKPTILFHGPIAEHDQACAICHSRKAVLQINTGVFLPCWICQNSWETRRIPWYRGLFRKDQPHA